MSDLNPILVAYDGSAPAKAAAACARALALRGGLRTILLHVIDPGDNLWDITLDGPARREQAVRELLAEEAARFTTPVEAVALDGTAADVIVTQADRSGAGVVAIGTRGRSTFGRAIFGSVALGVLQKVERPVLVAHEEVAAIRHVVVGVEDSSLASKVVAMARAVSDATGAALTMAHVMTTDRGIAARPESFGIPAEVWADAMKATADRVFGPHRQVAGPDAHERLLFGWTPDQLREYAAPLGAELVVVGRRGKMGRGLHHVWSVAVTLAMKGPFATLIV